MHNNLNMDTSGRPDTQTGARQRQTDADGNLAAPAGSMKGTFVDKLYPMMYGFGDDIEPLVETVDLVEDIVIDYSSGLLRMATDLAAARVPPGRRVTATAEDIATLVRKDPRKAARVKELLDLAPLLKKARYVEDEEEALVKYGTEEGTGGQQE